MTSNRDINARKLKKQLQARTATRRARRRTETDVVSALNGVGRNDMQPSLATVWKPVASLQVSERRARETTPQLLEGIVRSFRKFGILLPLLIDKHDTIVVGHGMWEAALRLGIVKVECRIIEHLDPAEMEAFSLAINRIGEIGSFDFDKLRDSMIRIETAGIELTSTGFTLPEIDQIKITAPVEKVESGDDECDDDFIVSVRGDLFALGRHHLLCDDALVEASYARVLGDRTAQCVFSDPPYNCPIKGFVGGLGQHQHEDFLMFAGKESAEKFFAFLTTFLRHCLAFTSPGAVIFAAMDWRQIDLLLQAGREAGLSRINLAVWNKGAGAMGSLYRSAHELIAVFCNGKSPATNNVALGVHGRDRTNVWTFAGANRKGSSAAQTLKDHPTPKSVELVVEALLDVTDQGDLVLDPFLGSGTTIMAAEQCDRTACGIELDPKYADRALRRWEKATGQEAVHVATGLTFAALRDQRRSDATHQEI